MKVSVIIPNWNGKSLLEECLPSLEHQTFKDFEVIVVDNSSSDDSVQFLKENYPKVKVLKLDKNYGFGTACNRGVEKSRSEYVVFLNNDTVLDKSYLKELVKCVENHPEVFSVNPKMLNYYNRDRFDAIGININEIGQGIGLANNEQDKGQYDKEMYIFGATGGASLFKRLEFLKLGKFDEEYFMYFEEVDLAFRAQFSGLKAIYCPRAIVFHKHKASSQKRPQNLEYWLFKNMTQTIIKDFPTTILLKNWRWFKLILVHFNTILYQLKNGFFWPPFAVEWYLITHFLDLINRRKRTQAMRQVPDEYIEQFLTPKRLTFWRGRK